MKTLKHSLRALDSQSVLTVLQNLWQLTFRVADVVPGHVEITMPFCGASGEQIVFEVAQSPNGFHLFDAGRTMKTLAQFGTCIDPRYEDVQIERIIRRAGVEREGDFISQTVRGSELDAVTLQIFGQALASISHLRVLHERDGREPTLGDALLQQILVERQLNHQIPGKLPLGDHRFLVNYMIDLPRPVAIQFLRRGLALSESLALWRYRWADARKSNPNLLCVMLYDPATFHISDWVRQTAESMCDLFCAGDETDRIEAFLDKAAGA